MYYQLINLGLGYWLMQKPEASSGFFKNSRGY